MFEPLVADWHHELSKAQAIGPWQVVQVFGSGAMAYVASFARSILMGEWLPTPRAAATATLAFGLAKAVALLHCLGLSYTWGPAVDLQFDSDAGVSAVLGRRRRTACLSAGTLPHAARSAVEPEARHRHDRVRRRRHQCDGRGDVGNSRSNSVFLDVRSVRTGTCPQTRQRSRRPVSVSRHRRPSAAGRHNARTAPRKLERFEAWRTEQIAKQPARTATWAWPSEIAAGSSSDPLRDDGLDARRTRRTDAAARDAWWGLMAVAMLALSATPGLFLRHPVNRPPYWATVPIVAAMTAALVIASWRKPPAQSLA